MISCVNLIELKYLIESKIVININILQEKSSETLIVEIPGIKSFFLIIHILLTLFALLNYSRIGY
jgi:hypothetical protein